MSGLPAVTDATFQQEVLEADKPVLVDFWAAWCGPCRMIAPILDELASEHGDAMKFVAMDLDANMATPPRYGITSIPTLNVYKGGELVKSIVGAQPKSMLLNQLSEFIG
ncbi:MAG TPA: thioredoxin [Nocardioidaceae bacterium]|nr:thioredoxin [Nocardioidaceae bacterium]